MKRIALCLVSAVVLLGNEVCVPAVMAQNYIQTTGTGLPNPKMSNLTQRRATARDAAIVQAQFKMLALINGSVPEAAGTRIHGVVKGAHVVKTEWAHNGRCTVTLRLDRDSLK